ncbi:MAG TPA: cytochrome c [Rubrivivax sp.]|jgi:cytochrome c556|nr:cytochrome c [Betaproteobacteria bacterium]HRC38305.1 cytochrome c [Rubrivivax sp.]
MTRLILAAVIGLTTALPAAAQFKNAEAAIKYRQSVMQVQNHHLGRIFAMVNGRMPFDAKVAAEDAALLDTIDKLPFVAFIDGTDKGETNAKSEIWKQRARFDAAALKMQEDVAKLNAAAKTGSLDAIKAAAGAVGQSCKACHDDYQAK